MKITSVQTLIDNIQYILSMPDLCDVMFIVGPQRVPVYGLKSILSTRSRLFFVMFLKHSKETMRQKKKTKKTKHNQPDKCNRLTIIIDNYDADIFRTFLLFVHCGSIVMEPSTVTGLLCLATEFDIPDLRNACWEFIERCLSVQAFSSLLTKATVFYGDHKAAQKLRLKILRISTKKSSTSSTVLRDSRIPKQDSRTSTETLV
ncbi:serine-enriched protein-like [Mytilus californianus]|uniref:serine-enriched protein-like n=1 Tax=Mytilus californianus TaxID=6549 RepID=UPI0022474638|nr:serine-enriched protein-like [Mytilus californianus]